jgi:hypothetical protein
MIILKHGDVAVLTKLRRSGGRGNIGTIRKSAGVRKTHRAGVGMHAGQTEDGAGEKPTNGADSATSNIQLGLMRKIIFALTTGLLCSTAALAQPPLERVGQAWHNGSLMNVFTRADLVRIEYLQPRPNLAAIGVIPGTVLLTGQ